MRKSNSPALSALLFFCVYKNFINSDKNYTFGRRYEAKKNIEICTVVNIILMLGS